MKHAGMPLLTASLLACVFSAFPSTLAFSLDRDRSITQFFRTTWSENDGAPSQISALAQTEDGYLWIGSTRGLFRFDGVKFEEYKPQSGVELPSHSIYSLMATPDGGLWIAFRPSGTGFLKDGSLSVFARPEEMPNSPIHSFARDHDGRIWAGTETGLVLRQGTRWIPIGREWNFGPDMIRDLFVDREGTLWVATVKIIAFLKQGSKAFELAGAVGRGVTTISQAKDGRVWYADVDKGGEVRPVPMAAPNSGTEGPAVVQDGLHELLFDRDGALWITRLDSGIVRIRHPEKLGNRQLRPQDPEWESFNEKAGFSGGFAIKLLEDREGNIWIGCSKGLIRFRNNHVVPVSLPQRFENLLLLAGEDGEIWIGNTGGKPLLHIRGDDLRLEKAGERAASVFRGSNGDVWWGCHDGIWRQNGTNFKYFALPKGVVPDWMYEIFPSRGDGGLWVKIGDIGVVHFHQGAWNLSDRPNGVPRVGPSANYLDSSGRVWLGFTAGQVYVLDGEKVTAYSRNDGLDVGRIKVIRGLGQHIWVGGELGLMFFSEGRFRKMNVAAGEPFGAISGIIETADGGLWLNEMRGIVQIPPGEIRQFLADPNHLVKFRRFDYLDGLPGAPQMAFTNSTAVQASDGRLWFATDDGLAWINPAHLVRNVVPPPVSILSVVNEQGRQTISNAVKFAAGTHTVEIDYTALSLSIPERVEFRYKLDGVDADWQKVGPRRQAYYSNLAPRRYRFRVIACNNDGVWNEAGAILDFSIAPAYYQTTWFGVACVAALLAFLWALYQYRLHQLARQFSLGVEERVGERTRIARELHDTLLQSFQGLMFRIQAARNMLPLRPEGALQALDGILTRSEQAIAESRDAIQDLHSEPVAQSDLADMLTAMGQELAASQDAQPDAPNFSVTVEGEKQTVSPVIQDEVYRIAREVLRNAFRHACARHIEAEIRYDHRSLRLRIRDDGKGLDPEVLKKGGRAGHWGLPGIRERAKRIGARLDFWSEAGAGTEVQLTVPAFVVYATSAAGRRFWFFGVGRKSKVESPKSKVES